ncbi:hypothetical protein DPMN_004693 [Dreissena polymorpha]|uniref:Uncharacterized protein n=1 Tax=Dreissena polymorpha TaxID=45954 RepID=A0A9D4RW48_DREPO|nr:hypothetical protein DPMN_004693 [Dreissena polymorpha]
MPNLARGFSSVNKKPARPARTPAKLKGASAGQKLGVKSLHHNINQIKRKIISLQYGQ